MNNVIQHKYVAALEDLAFSTAAARVTFTLPETPPVATAGAGLVMEFTKSVCVTATAGIVATTSMFIPT